MSVSADTDAIYARAGFGAQVRRGPRPALVVVDLSRGFTEPEHATGAELGDVVAAAAALVDAAHASDAPVIFTTIAYDANLRDGGAWLEKAPGLAILQRGTPLVELDPRLPRDPRDTLIVKQGASSFSGTGLAAVLSAARVDTVVACGATTSGCVRATVVDSVQSGFRTLVVREACGDRAPEPHAANLFDMQAKYADVIALDDAVAYLRAPGAA